MKKRFILIFILFLMTLMPFFFPKYPDFQDISKTYEWGDIETQTISHIVDKENLTGYISTQVILHSHSMNDKKCEFELLDSEAQSESGLLIDGRMKTVEPYRRKKGVPTLIPVYASGTAPITNVNIFLKIKTGSNCKPSNSILEVEEVLVLKMRHYTLWGFLFNFLLSV